MLVVRIEGPDTTLNLEGRYRGFMEKVDEARNPVLWIRVSAVAVVRFREKR